MTKDREARAVEPLSVRLPPGMRSKIREHAKANRRSMNAEIVHYLDRALAGQPENTSDEVKEQA